MNERLSEHRNRARYVNKMFDSMYKRSHAHTSPALSDFTVDLIDTEDWESKFEKKDQKTNVMIKRVHELSSKDILQRLDFREEELPNYAMFAPFSGIFCVVNFTLRKNLAQKYSPTKIKYIVEHAFFMKSSYDYVPVILTHRFNPIDSMRGIKQTLFRIDSFTEQKFEVTLLQQSPATVLNEYLPEWTIEIFKEGFGLNRASDTYRRHLILKCVSGGTGKSTMGRLLAFGLNFRNYISLESFPTEKRRNSIMYFLAKLKRQVVILDLVRAPFSKTNIRFVKKKVNHDIEQEFKILVPQKYKTQVIKAKDDILRLARKRLVSEARNSAILGSAESEKIRTFLEMFIQGCTTEERYFFRISVMDTPMHILILNSTEFMEYLSSDYRENACVIEITKEKSVPNKSKVKYHHLLPGFVENDVLGHIFDGVSPATVNLAHLGVCRDLLELSPEP